MTKDDVLFGYGQALSAEAARTGIAQACRRFGVRRSTYYAWKRQVDHYGSGERCCAQESGAAPG
jgi:transposase-like protein